VQPGRERPSPDHPRDGDEPHLDVPPDEPVGDFGDDGQSDAGGDSDPGDA